MRKSALITGASKRIGKQIAIALGKNGYHIHLHYFRSQKQAEQTIQELKQEGISSDLIQADLQNPPEIEHMMQAIQNTASDLTVIVNNASVFIPASLQDTDIELWDTIMTVNLRAPWLIVKNSFDMLQKNNGCVINILDSGIEKVWPGYAPYQVSKVGLAQVTKLMAKTYAPNIRVNGIAPGLMLPAENEDASDLEHIIKRLPMQKEGQPEDIASGVLFLIQQKYITGEILFIDGGYQYI